MEMSNLLLKFGKKEHLEMLLNGSMFFNLVKSYRNDKSKNRGDSDEGCKPINPTSVKLIDSDGNNIFDLVHLPDTVREFRQGDENTLMFCCTEITKKILTKKNNSYNFKNEYKESIKDFGDYVLLFSKDEILNRLYIESGKKDSKFGYIADSIKYMNLNNFNNPIIYRNNKSVFDPFFKKDKIYEIQNEYRVIIDGKNKALSINDYGGYIIELGKLTWAHIYKAELFLEDFYIIEEEETINNKSEDSTVSTKE